MTGHASTAPDLGVLVPSFLIAAAGAGLVTAVLSGSHLPFVSSDRDAFVALAVLGWIGCSVAVGRDSAALGWTHPAILAAAVLGVLALTVVVAFALGRTGLFAGLGGGSADRGAFLVLAAILGTKVALRVLVAAFPRAA